MEAVSVIWLGGGALFCACVVIWISRTPKMTDLRVVCVAGFVLTSTVGLVAGEHEADSRQRQLRTMVEGFAPTYAQELSRHGHAKIGLDTPPDDPLYLELIDLQRSWIAINPSIADIYTLRSTDGGEVALIVDSETDYDRNGRFEGAREARTAIGEIYEDADSEMFAALAGTAQFLEEPTKDRWGVWVSAFVPMYDESGRVEAVCGVDHHASEWLRVAFDARSEVYARASVFQLLGAVGLIWITRSRAELARREATEVELRDAVTEAQAGQRAKSEFLATMSHEIRTPMNGVLGMTDLLLDTELTREQRQFSLTIRDSGRHLLHVINQILDFTKGEAGRFELDLAACDLRALLEESVGLLAELAHRKGLELSLVERDGVADAYLADATRLRQIVVNLVGNAIKFTDAGEVVVEVSGIGGTAASRVRIAVHDTGIGLPQDARERIFEVFTQVDTGTARRHEGTGLGLAICKQIVEQMGGEIGVEGSLGRGSTFWFEVPLALADASGRDPIADSARIAGRRVLIVDDNATHRDVLRRHLAQWRVDCVECEGGFDALAELRVARERGEHYDAAVVDLMMPEMDGIEFVRRLRADASAKALPVVLMTSVRVDEGELAGLDVGARLTKPVRRADLYATMVAALANHEPEPRADATLSATHPRTQRPVRVLVVEDNPVNQRVTTAMLAKVGCESVVVGDGGGALDRMARESFDLVLMDVMLPEMDGLEVTRRIRQLRAERGVAGAEGVRLPILAVTAHGAKEDRDECLAAGMDDFLTKPFGLDQLISRLERWLPQAFSTTPQGGEEA